MFCGRRAFLQQHNVRVHDAKGKLEKYKGSDVLPRSLYSPDFTALDYILFRINARILRRQRFNNMDDVKDRFTDGFISRISVELIELLVKRWPNTI